MSGDPRHQYPHRYESTLDYDVDSESPIPKSAEYKRYSVVSTSEWLLEISTSVLSIVLLGVIVGIFYYMDDKPLSAWSSFISLNAAISILTTACSAALMHGVSEFISQLKWLHFKGKPQRLYDFERFDAASRGPWGSIKFLTTVKWNLATIGALITISRLAFAPLAQQVVKIDQRFVNVTDKDVAFGYAHAYNRGLGRDMFNSDVKGIRQDAGMQAAIVQGFYGISTPATFTCPGSTCTWNGTYISLGFKTQCKNVTQETLKSKKCFPMTEKPSTQRCNMTTPAGLVVSAHYAATDLSTTYYMNASSKIAPNQVKLPPGFPKIVYFAIYRSTSDGNFNSWDINVTDCSLSLTAYEHVGARANGTEFSFEETREVNFGQKSPWGADDVISSGMVYTNKSQADGIPALNISWPDLKALQTFFQSDIIVTEWVDGNWDNESLGISAALMGNVSISERFEKMATAMSDYLRSGPNRKLAKGQRLETEVYVFIQWYYLIGPAAIGILGLGFAIFTIFANRKSRNVPVWKSSAIAALACQHDRRSGTIQSETKDIKEIEETAKNSLVQLQ